MDTNPDDATIVSDAPWAQATPPPTIGDRFGRYELRESIGEGAMGCVFLAHDPHLDRDIALKVLRRHAHEADDRGAKRLLREARSLARLEHPAVVSVFEVGHEGPHTFIAMEYVRGQTLMQWQRQPGRHASEILETYRQAGRGLAAAHAVDIIHRDFKPANVLVGDDGRVRVADFGIAHLGPPRFERSLDPQAPSTDDPLQTSLTAGGMVMGTPAYMAPEQARGEAVDHRADQYAFCVALYEALFRTRPFHGATLEELATSKRAGVVAPPSEDGLEVSGPVRKAILRGLRPDPEQRWPSMRALLDALQPPRRRRWPWAIGGLVIATAIGAWLLWPTPDAVTCDPPASTFDGVWDDATQQRLRAAFHRPEHPALAEIWPRLAPRVDAYVEAWREGYRAACTASRIEGTQDASVLDRRMHCLRRRRGALAALTDALADGNPEVLTEAGRAASTLPRLETCAEVDALTSEILPPEDPAIERQVEALRRRLGVADTWDLAGQFDAAAALADEIRAEAEPLGYAPLVLEAKMRLGRVYARQQKLEEATVLLEEVTLGASAIGYRHLEAMAASYLSHLVGNYRGDTEAGLHWGRHALAVYEAGDLEPEVLASIQTNLGGVYFASGKMDEARELYESALEIRERVQGPHHYETGIVLSNLAGILVQLGDLDLAQAHYERVVEIWEATLGPRHPNMGYLFNGLAAIYERRNQFAKAIPLVERAVEIRRTRLGPDHPEVATALETLGSLLMQDGRLAEARPLFDKALEIRQAHYEPTHLHLGSSWTNFAMLAEKEGDFAQAQRHAQTATRIFEEQLGLEHPFLAYPLTIGGIAARELGDLDTAQARLDRALAIQRKQPTPPFELARTELALARTLEARGARAEAVELARAALTHVEPEESIDPARVAEIRRWLTTHPAPSGPSVAPP